MFLISSVSKSDSWRIANHGELFQIDLFSKAVQPEYWDGVKTVMFLEGSCNGQTFDGGISEKNDE